VLLSHWVLPYFVVASAPFETCLLETMFPNNSDGAFLNQHEPKPSDLLLHYNYGAAAVKHWGRNVDVLDKRPDLPRPKELDNVVMGPTTSVGDRAKPIDKLTAAQAEGSHGGGMGSAAGTTSEQPVGDKDEVMLFFWGNSMAARERHATKEQVRKGTIDKWRTGTGV
jgi:hypothetical protein